ncbi:Latrophilin-like protein 1 [Stylophora pistillata]|uniref:Latrophilin-like protein 1 n=1 Tax=Stylophora pistillata TaxID=50429 RepID=A0A2B4RRB8_STYPI|nr:Latrophilin-like protein 1 [Stylophora pistillata]
MMLYDLNSIANKDFQYLVINSIIGSIESWKVKDIVELLQSSFVIGSALHALETASPESLGKILVKISMTILEKIADSVLAVTAADEKPISITAGHLSMMLRRYTLDSLSGLETRAGKGRVILPPESHLSVSGVSKTSFVDVQVVTKERVDTDVLSLKLKDDKNEQIKISNLSDDIIIVTPLKHQQNFKEKQWYFRRSDDLRSHVINVKYENTLLMLDMKPQNPTLHMFAFVRQRFGQRPTVQDHDLNATISHNEKEKRSCSGGRRRKRSCIELKDPPFTPQVYDSTTDQNHTLKVSSGSCVYWSEKLEMRLASGCQILVATDGFINCGCNHLTSFGGCVLVKPNPIDLDKVLQQFQRLSETGNITLIVAISVELLCYITVLVIVMKADKEDARNVSLECVVIVLPMLLKSCQKVAFGSANTNSTYMTERNDDDEMLPVVGNTPVINTSVDMECSEGNCKPQHCKADICDLKCSGGGCKIQRCESQVKNCTMHQGCSRNECEQTCQAAQKCEMNCNGGGCKIQKCENQAKECKMHLGCSRQDCEQTCKAETCDMECSGGGCTKQICEIGKVCNMHCNAVNCTQTCKAKACSMTRTWPISSQDKLVCSGNGECCGRVMSSYDRPSLSTRIFHTCPNGESCTCSKYVNSLYSTQKLSTSNVVTSAGIPLFATKTSTGHGTRGYSEYNKYISSGGFSGRGCYVIPSESNSEDTVCSCDHLTHFAVLVDYNGSPGLTEEDETILEIITYVGLSLSILGMLLTIILYSFLTDIWQPLSQIRVSLSVALGAGQIIFLAGIDATENMGILIFVLHCVRNSQIRERLKRKMSLICPSAADHGNSVKNSSQVNPSAVGNAWAVEMQSFRE